MKSVAGSEILRPQPSRSHGLDMFVSARATYVCGGAGRGWLAKGLGWGRASVEGPSALLGLRRKVERG